MWEKRTKKVTVRFSKRLKSEMLKSLVNSNYGLRGKSKWLMEAIQLFLEKANFVELSEQGIDLNQAELSEVEAFYLDSSTNELVQKASLEIRKSKPLFEGVQSAVIRSAVIYRLMLGK